MSSYINSNCHWGVIELHLPKTAVSDRVSVRTPLPENQRRTCANLDGPGCIRHIWAATDNPHKEMANRHIIIRIFFDDEPIPFVEAPMGDFFGVMHGLPWYPINTSYLSVQAQNSYNCYFPMPFAKSARIELETDQQSVLYLMVDWHRYPGQELEEPRRFCARWRREMPTQRYGEDFVVLDADGPGQLLGFVYGVRLMDDVDRWSHGGGDNIYIDGDGEHPAYLRGIGGEDAFGTSHGGAIHPPETHLYAAMPYYIHEDIGQARPAQRLVGYRFFEHDSLRFRKSIHMRFGSMCNDICSIVYWYQEKPVRPFFEIPDWPLLLPGSKLPRGICDLPLPPSGEWWLCGPFANKDNQAMETALPSESEFSADATYDGMHETGSPWLSAGSQQAGRDVARFVKRSADHGFIDFNHVFRPCQLGTPGYHYSVSPLGVAAVARCILNTSADMTAHLRLSWDDHMILRVNDGEPMDLGCHAAFRAQTVEVPLRAGANLVVLKLANEAGSNNGGWAFAFRATTPDGTVLLPKAEAD